MKKIQLGRTGLMVTRTSFGALPIQRVDFDTAKAIFRKAFDAGINFYDTARGYSDSEEKIGYSLSDVRKDIIIATKCSGAKNRQDVLSMIETSLKNMKTDYIDILQLHNPKEIPDPDDPQSTYAGMVEAQKAGKIRFIGITNHRLAVAGEAVESGLFDTLQFPLSAIAAEEDFALAKRCGELDVGFIAMKALCGGLLSNPRLAFAGFQNAPNAVPIWGIQRMSELEEILALDADPPELTPAVKAEIAREKAALAGEFCRGCGYCLPCPADIPIYMAARMDLLRKRAPSEQFKSPEWQERMGRIENCTECYACARRCPYGLDTPALLRDNLAKYQAWLAEESA